MSYAHGLKFKQNGLSTLEAMDTPTACDRRGGRAVSSRCPGCDHLVVDYVHVRPLLHTVCSLLSRLSCKVNHFDAQEGVIGQKNGTSTTMMTNTTRVRGRPMMM